MSEIITKDPDFIFLKEKLNSPNAFNFLGNLSYEIRHSNFIAWLLNPNESHCKGNLFLEKFLDTICEKKPRDNETFNFYREKDHIDILIVSQYRAIVIENKLTSKDFDGQLLRYRNKINKEFGDKERIFIFWTVDGSDPVDTDEKRFWKLYSYENFVNGFEPLLASLIGDKTSLYLGDYIESLKINFLKKSNYSEIARNLVDRNKNTISKIFLDINQFDYANKRTLEFLEKNSTFTRGLGFFSKDKTYLAAFNLASSANQFEPTRVGKKQSTYFGFIPRNVFDLVDRKEICFEFTFRYFERNNCLRLTFGLGPETPENKDVRNLLLKNIDRYHSIEFSVPVNARGTHYIGISRKDILFNPMDLEETEIELAINKIFTEQVKNFVKDINEVTVNFLKGRNKRC
jgi:hypothetical protein